MSESYALQKTRNIRPVITQATDNKLQAFPCGATEIGCLSVDDFVRNEKGFPIAFQVLFTLLMADTSLNAWCRLLLLSFGLLCFHVVFFFVQRLGRQCLLRCRRELGGLGGLGLLRLLCLFLLLVGNNFFDNCREGLLLFGLFSYIQIMG